MLGEKKQSTREYLSTAMSTLSTDQITRVEQQISDLDVQIKRFQSASPDNQADVSGGADTNSVSTPAESISGGTRDDPTSSALSKASNGTSVDASTRTSTTPLTVTSAPPTTAAQGPTPTTGAQIKPTTVREQYRLRLAGTAQDLRTAKATNPKATIFIQSSFYLFALALIAPKVEEVQPAAIADFTAKAEDIKTDKQTGTGQGFGGTTSLVTKASIPAAFGFAVENGALTRTDNKTIVTFSGTPVGIIEALAKKGFIESYQKDDSFDRALRNFSFKLNFDTNRGSTPGTFTGNKQQLAGYSLRYKLIDQRDPRDKKYTEQWASLVANEGVRVTAVLGDFFRQIFKTPTPRLHRMAEGNGKCCGECCTCGRGGSSLEAVG